MGASASVDQVQIICSNVERAVPRTPRGSRDVEHCDRDGLTDVISRAEQDVKAFYEAAWESCVATASVGRLLAATAALQDEFSPADPPRCALPQGATVEALVRRTRRLGRDGVDDERSPLLRWLENYVRGVARGQRVPSHPLYLPVPVATPSYERRVFACASPSSLRPSQLLGSLHNSAYSRSGGPSKTAIPSQRAAKTLHNVDHEARRTFDRLYPGGVSGFNGNNITCGQA